MSSHFNRVLALLSLVLVTVHCAPTKPTEQTATTTVATTSITSTIPVSSTMTFQITDGCSDGFALRFKLYDMTGNRNNGVWPTSTTHYLTPVGGTATQAISCTTGANICYGARADRTPLENFWWGIDLDASKGCDSCCNTCSTRTVAIRPTC